MNAILCTPLLTPTRVFKNSILKLFYRSKWFQIFMRSYTYHANVDLVSDTPSDVVNQGLDTIFGGEKIMIMIEVFCMIMKNMAQSLEKAFTLVVS